MRPSNFFLSLLPFLLPLAGCDLASEARQCGLDTDYPSTGVDPIELLGVFSRLTLISQDMRLETLSADKQTASDTLDVSPCASSFPSPRNQHEVFLCSIVKVILTNLIMALDLTESLGRHIIPVLYARQLHPATRKHGSL